MLLVNAPVPEPSIVFVVNAIVGLAVVLQHIPLAVIVAPPSEVMFPPDVAVLVVIFVGVLVEKIVVVGIIVVSRRQRTENPKSLELLFLFTSLLRYYRFRLQALVVLFSVELHQNPL